MDAEEQLHFERFCDSTLSDWQSRGSGTDEDSELIEQIVAYVSTEFGRRKYVLGLAIDFVILAEQVAEYDSTYVPFAKGSTFDNDIEPLYPLVKKTRSGKANTLTLKVGDDKAVIRRTEQQVLETFTMMKRSNYPSAYVYNTGQWDKYKDLLSMTFQLSDDGRLLAVRALFEYGLEQLEKNTYYTRPTIRVRLFESFLEGYKRADKRENGGLTFQALTYGFLIAEYPHLHVLADKVRTGSSRQHRTGDIDLYYGLDLELSAEVKDLGLDADSYTDQIGSFLENIQVSGVSGLVVCQDVDETAFDAIMASQCQVYTDSQLLEVVARWDWQKQDRAVQGYLHYLAHIEQNPKAVQRALEYIKLLDASHSSLDFLEEE